MTDLRYYGSQPWGVDSNLLLGYFARLDGPGEIRLDRQELAQAGWYRPEEIDLAPDGYSLTNAINNGFHGVDTAMCNLGTQLQQCCCDNARAIDGVNYNLATQTNGIQTAIQGVRYDMATQACDTRNTIQNSTRDIIDNANANSRAILDFLTQDKIATLTAENQSLKFQASQAAQNAFITANQEAQTAELIRRINPMPVPAYQVPNPYAGCGCYSSCGCGC